MVALVPGLFAVLPALVGLILQARDAQSRMLKQVEREAEVLEKVTDPHAKVILAKAHRATVHAYDRRVRGKDRMVVAARRLLWTIFLSGPALVFVLWLTQSPDQTYVDRSLARVLLLITVGVVADAMVLQLVPLTMGSLRERQRKTKSDPPK